MALFIQAFIWHPVVGLVVAVFAVGAIGVAVGGPAANQILEGRTTTQTASGSVAAAPALAVQGAPTSAPAPSVDQYIKGMTTFDANLMWNALDPTAIQAMESQGGSLQTLQDRLNQAKQNGATYDSVAFIGGYPLQNGDRYLFYVVSRRGFAGPGVPDQVFFVFTVGQNGKILKIE
jgi:hypothetical protein